MGNIAQQFATAFRDFIVDGVASSGPHEVIKEEVRAIGPILEVAIANAALGSLLDVVKDTRANLNADLAHPADAVALVYGDATDANNDLYIKVGASGSGSWTLTNALHTIITTLTDPIRARAANAVPFDTWSDLAAATKMVAGDRASVLASDTGTHTDPVVGGTVDNAGVYEYSASPAGWERVADLDSATASAFADTAGVAATAAEEAADAAAAVADLLASQAPSRVADIIRFDGDFTRSVFPATAIGRAYMLESGAFAFVTSTAQERTHYENGVRKGFYFEVAEDIASAPWHDTIPGASDPHFITSSNRGTGATQAYATQHSAPDRFGTTGKGVLLTQGSSVPNGQVRFNNLTKAGVSGDIMRVVCKFSIISVSGAATFAPIRTRQISGTVSQFAATLGFDASGVIDPATFTPPAASTILRSGIERLEDTVSGDVPVWMAWIDLPLTATGTLGVALDEPNALVASQIMIHEMEIIKNPKGRVSPLPHCQAAPAFAADNLAIASAVELFDIEFRRLARKHSRLPGTALQLPAVDQGNNRYAISGPLWPYEDEIVIRPAREATGYAGILPSRNAAEDLKQLQLRKSWNLRAKGYFAEQIGTESGGSAGDIDLRGFSDTDLFELPWVRLTTSGLELTNLRLDAVIYSASSQFTSQTEQVEVGENITSDLNIGGNFTMMFGGMVGHPLAHSRARRFSHPRVQADGENPLFIGTAVIKPQATCTMTMKNITAHGMARCWQIVANGSAIQLTYDYDNWDVFRFSSDGIYPGRGAAQPGSLWDNIVIRGSTYLRENFFQCAPDMPLWIDTGSGFESIEDYAAGLSLTVQQAVDTLPLGRKFQYYGYLNAPYTGSPDRTLSNLVVDPSTTSYVAFSEPATTNIGNGIMTGLAAAEPLAEGVYTLTITAAAANAGSFQVVGPNNYFATGTVGAAFSRLGLSFTLPDGATDFVVGDTIKIKVKRFDYERGYVLVTRFNVRETITATIAANKPGYQFHATNRRFGPDYNDNVIPVDTAWLATGDKAPSPSNPHMMFVRGDKRYVFNTGLWGGTAITDNTGVLENSGLHADPVQVNRTGHTANGWTIRNMVVISRGQGALYMPGTETNMLVNCTIENVFAAVTGSNAGLFGPGNVSLTIDKMLVGPLWTAQVFANGSKNATGFRVQGGAATLTNCFAARPAISAAAENGTGLVVDPGASVTGTVGVIRAGQQQYNITEPPSTRRSGGVVVAPSITSLCANPAMIENGYFSSKLPIEQWEFSPYAIKLLGFDPMLGAKNMLAAPINRTAFHLIVQNVLHQHPVAHGQMDNDLAVGDEVVLYDEDGAVVRLPGHTIDFHFGDGYGKDGPWRITEDGRVLLRWSLAGRDIFRRILTRKPDGSYGPIITINVVVP